MKRAPVLRRRPYRLLAELETVARDKPPTKSAARDKPPTKSAARDKPPGSYIQLAQEVVVTNAGPLSQPLRGPSETPSAKAKDKQKVCKYCGHVNKDVIYCEKCRRPLSDSMLKKWLLQRYFEAFVMNAESMNEVVGTQEGISLGDVKADYVIYHKDGSETVLVVTTKFDEILANLIRYNAEKRKKIEVVFLHVSTVNVPRLGEEIIRQASLYNITVRFFPA